MRCWAIFGWLILLVVLACSHSISWADDHFEDDLQLWIPITLELPVSDKVTGSLQVEPRIFDNLRDPTLRSIAPSISYDINDNVTITTGGGWYFNFAPFESEERLFQQLILRKQFSKVRATVRASLEERFFEGTNGATLRNRYMLRFQGPIGKTPWYWATFNEIHLFLNSQENGPRAGFNQNRLFVGVGRDINKKISMEGGYQLQISNQPGNVDQMNHVILTRLNYKLR